MRTTCKNCWKKMGKDLINNNRNFCSKKCRLDWMRKHNVKGAKKKYKYYDPIHNHVGLTHSCLDKNSD